MSGLKKDKAKVNKKVNEHIKNDLDFQNTYIFTKEECDESLTIIDSLKSAIKKLRDKNLLLVDLKDIYEFYTLCSKMRNKLKYWAYCGELQIEVSKFKMFSDLLGDVSKDKIEPKK